MNISNISSYAAISSGSKLTSAASNPAGLVISEKFEAQTNGLAQEVNNIKSSQNLYNTADGAYNSISDNLQRMKELSVQASNGILSKSDKSAIQDEVNQIKDSINDIIKNTEFNGIKMLDGQASDTLGMKQMSLDKLGIKDFDVTGKFSIEDIDKAIETLNKDRSQVGASYNALTHNANNKENYRLNLTSSLSNIKDTDIAEEINKMKTQDLLNTYKLTLQQKDMENKKNNINYLF